MKAEEFMELFNTLPDEMITSAVQTEPKRNRKIIFAFSTIAACLVLVLAAAIYPKLRTQKPPIADPPRSTTAAVTTATTPREQAVSTTQTVTERTSPVQTTEITMTQTRTASTATVIPKTDAPPMVTTFAKTTAPNTTARTTQASATTGIEAQQEDSPQSETAVTETINMPLTKRKINVPPDVTEVYTEQYHYTVAVSTPELSSNPDTPCYDDVIVTIYTRNTNISINSGQLRSGQLALNADCLMTTDGDFSIRAYQFQISIPHGMIDEYFSCYVKFQYRNDLNFVDNTENLISVEMMEDIPGTTNT